MKNESELIIFAKMKDLTNYVFNVTKKSPKTFRHTFVLRMQNLCLDIITNLYMANELQLSEQYQRRINLQTESLSQLKVLNFIAYQAFENLCILEKQFEQISMKCLECKNILAGWIVSDKKRYKTL